MSPDRYGEPSEKPKCSDPRCGNGCPPGWIGHDSERRPIPCLQCKGHLIAGTSTITDYSGREPSARAKQAIESETE